MRHPWPTKSSFHNIITIQAGRVSWWTISYIYLKSNPFTDSSSHCLNYFIYNLETSISQILICLVWNNHSNRITSSNSFESVQYLPEDDKVLRQRLLGIPFFPRSFFNFWTVTSVIMPLEYLLLLISPRLLHSPIHMGLCSRCMNVFNEFSTNRWSGKLTTWSPMLYPLGRQVVKPHVRVTLFYKLIHTRLYCWQYKFNGQQ